MGSPPAAAAARRIPAELARRCFNCHSYRHKVATCRLPRRCLRCHGYRHLARDCTRLRFNAEAVLEGAGDQRRFVTSRHGGGGGGITPHSGGVRRVGGVGPAMAVGGRVSGSNAGGVHVTPAKGQSCRSKTATATSSRTVEDEDPLLLAILGATTSRDSLPSPDPMLLEVLLGSRERARQGLETPVGDGDSGGVGSCDMALSLRAEVGQEAVDEPPVTVLTACSPAESQRFIPWIEAEMTVLAVEGEQPVAADGTCTPTEELTESEAEPGEFIVEDAPVAVDELPVPTMGTARSPADWPRAGAVAVSVDNTEVELGTLADDEEAEAFFASLQTKSRGLLRSLSPARGGQTKTMAVIGPQNNLIIIITILITRGVIPIRG
ncbi:hypothetical protein BS78_09G049400 [Paspalum vaginatum]|nr:hypothetical protein BS78_09G049400 [Paspalum vaginatum]